MPERSKLASGEWIESESLARLGSESTSSDSNEYTVSEFVTFARLGRIIKFSSAVVSESEASDGESVGEEEYPLIVCCCSRICLISGRSKVKVAISRVLAPAWLSLTGTPAQLLQHNSLNPRTEQYCLKLAILQNTDLSS